MFNDIKFILKKTVSRSGYSEKVDETIILGRLHDEIKRQIGKELATFVRPVYFKDNIVAIASLSDKASIIIKKQEEEILANINNNFTEFKIISIKYLT